jgi:lambda family phage minor tail protein L
MPETINATFTGEKNKLENRPITLYEIEVGGASTLWLAEYDATVEYPSGSGTNYIPAPITHEGISINAMGEIDAVKMKVSNVNRQIWAVVMAHNGLRGEKVTMRLVFADHLDDAAAHKDAVYYVDAPDYDESKEEATFLLTSRLDLYEVKTPGRIMQRDECGWTYKKEGCWLYSGGTYAARANFANEAAECDQTRDGAAGCRFHHPSGPLPFGGFPGIPLRGVYLQ